MKLTPPTTIEAVRDTIRQMVVGVVTPAHDETGHWYVFPSGKKVASVTSKISTPKPHLLKWYGRQAVEFMEPMWPLVTPENREDLFTQASLAGENVRDNAGTIGSAGHDAIERWINEWIAKGAAPSDIVPFVVGSDPSAIAVARSAQKFFKDHPYYIPIWSELLVGDEKLGIAGTLDVLLWDTWTNKIIVGDWKSSNQVDDISYAIQVSTYAHCFEVMTCLKVSKCLVFLLSKKRDDYKIYRIKRPKQAFQIYLKMAKIYDWVHDGILKMDDGKNIIRL